MWQDHRNLRCILRSVSGIDGRLEPYYNRYNKDAKPDARLEYTTEKPPAAIIPDVIYQTSAGRIVLGDYLTIGDKQICPGNFTDIFEYNGEKYVVDTLAQEGNYHFRLIRIHDDGSVETVYTTAEDEYYDTLDRMGSAALDAYCIETDMFGVEVVTFLCSGINSVNPKRIRKVQFLLILDTDKGGDHLLRIDLTEVKFSNVTSIWTDGMILAIGCDNQVVKAHLPNISIEYWTGLEKSIPS